jgi:hypothetical protein
MFEKLTRRPGGNGEVKGTVEFAGHPIETVTEIFQQ